MLFMFPGLSRYFPFLSPATCQPDAMQSPLSSPFARENPFPVAIGSDVKAWWKSPHLTRQNETGRRCSFYWLASRTCAFCIHQ
ncbi:hypothetical protein QCA22_004219 [Salmonella enterica]|nr:hypothetical protein [Salmonella enterica]EKS5829380.1 hypothetical protein [Salmonella enterica]EKS5883720.1 hypothetical protein [Salmonella enterica]